MKKQTYDSIPWVIDGELYDEGSPWAIRANNVHKKNGITLEESRDIVILEWLLKGDLRPLQALLIMGKAPAPAILHAIGLMMNPDASTPEQIPFSLVLEGRTGKRGVRNNPENDIRDYCLYENVQAFMNEAGKGSYESAIFEIAKKFSLGQQLVRDAYDKNKKSSLG